MDKILEDNGNLFNAIACVYFSGFLLMGIFRQHIPYGRHGRIERSESPKLYWLLMAVIGIVAAWTGVAFVLHRA